ncbi:FRG domain [Legionella beliardensis]|uniref:FRG domain n=1 Tax=Legionella beliardensis TaxID=91822 RepID=A0A378I168_9GAMM|nr:FRG domain-containing protein [Legionella beliardensis]STX28470.1 FRG domain [Legionella beliardensis]
MSQDILIAYEKDINKKYRDKDFYEKIPIFSSWKSYVLEEIYPECVIPVNRVEDINNLINSLKIEKNLIFRGHENPTWKLCPTLHRKYIGGFPRKIELDKYLAQFQTALINEAGKSKDNKLHINAEYELTIKEIHELEEQSLWEIGQHYGLNTEYLDWTQNINNALYFCFEPEQWDKAFPYRALYVLNKNLPDKALNQINIIFPVNANNLRMKNQEGIFTKITIEQTFEKIISDNLKIFTKYFRKIYISCNKRKSFIDKLHAQNINYQKLFTGLEGSVRHCNSLISTRAFGGGILFTISQEVIPSKKNLFVKLKNLLLNCLIKFK